MERKGPKLAIVTWIFENHEFLGGKKKKEDDNDQNLFLCGGKNETELELLRVFLSIT